MTEDIWQQVEQWLAEGAYDEALAALETMSLEERGYRLSVILGQLYVQKGREAEALAALEAWRQEGTDDSLWHHQYGRALLGLERFAEAAEAFEQALLLDETDEASQQALKDCRYQLEREEMGRTMGTDCALATQYILRYTLADMLEDAVLQAEAVYLPRWQLTIRPLAAQLTEQSAVIYLYISAADWGGMELFECTAGMGKDTVQAIGQAMASFLFGMWNGLQAMLEQWEPRELVSHFGGREHQWSVYLSDIVGIGQTPEVHDAALYWQALAEEIAQRVGDQPLCYVKVYAAKNGGDITGECRINDVRSEELSQRVAEMAAKWGTEGFGSHKQFFFLQQAQATRQDYPWSKSELQEKTRQAVRLLHELILEERPEDWAEALDDAMADDDLSTELCLFLPEMCAENYFQAIDYPETVTFVWDDGRKETVYKTQLRAYYPLYEALFQGFDNGAFAGYENEVYSQLIGRSATYNVVMEAKEKGADLAQDGGRITLIFSARDTYRLR